MGLKAAGINGRQADALFHHAHLPRLGKAVGQHPPNARQLEQPSRRFLERREIGRRRQIDYCSQGRAVRQQTFRPAVIQLQKFLEHQAGEQLMLRELLGAATMTVGRQAASSHATRHQKHPLGRLARGSHARSTHETMLAG